MFPFYLSLTFVDTIDATIGGCYPNQISGKNGTCFDGCRYGASVGCRVDKGIANLAIPEFFEGLVVESYKSALGCAENDFTVGEQGGRGNVDAIFQVFAYDSATGMSIQDEECLFRNDVNQIAVNGSRGATVAQATVAACPQQFAVVSVVGIECAPLHRPDYYIVVSRKGGCGAFSSVPGIVSPQEFAAGCVESRKCFT